MNSGGNQGEERASAAAGGLQPFTATPHPTNEFPNTITFLTSTIRLSHTSSDAAFLSSIAHPITSSAPPAPPNTTPTPVSSERVAALTLEAQITVIVGVIVGCCLAGLAGYLVSRCQGWRYLTKADRNSRRADRIRRSRESTGMQAQPPMTEDVHRAHPMMSRRSSVVQGPPPAHDGYSSPAVDGKHEGKLSRHNSLVPTPLFDEHTIGLEAWVAITTPIENGSSSTEETGNRNQVLPSHTQSLPSKTDGRGSITKNPVTQNRSTSHQQSNSSTPTVSPWEIENMAYQRFQLDGAADDSSCASSFDTPICPISRQSSRNSSRLRQQARDAIVCTLSSPPVAMSNQISPKKQAPAQASPHRDTLEHIVRMGLRNISSDQESDYSPAANSRAISWARSVKGGGVGVGSVPGSARRGAGGSSVMSVISDGELERLGVGKRAVDFLRMI